MKKLKGIDSITAEHLHAIVVNQFDKYWRYYLMWNERSDLARDDPKKFIELESKSGSAMWDDPPEGWSERDLFIWSKGYVHARQVECANISGTMDLMSFISKKLINKDYGFRDGMPSIEQIKRHEFNGFWIIKVKDTDEDSFEPYYPIFHALSIIDNRIRFWDDDIRNWKIYLKKNMKKVLSTIPIDRDFLPVSWNALNDK